VLVTADESAPVTGFGPDPVGDQAAEILPGLLQKYARRALLITTGACAVHCRYCFRRSYPYSAVPKSPAAWEPALEHIARDGSLDEVILSGGDPLMLSDTSLGWLVERLNQIPHIVRLRIHTRVPVVIPQRVCPELLDWLGRARQQVVWVTHINHPQEIDDRLQQSLHQLHAHGAVLLNQAVLLRGINDSSDTLEQLSQRLLAARVLPYYLHQLDQVTGAAHFEVTIKQGRELIDQLRASSSGYGVPKYVVEVAGDSSKRPL
jgi:EF-P beta-lysylation protein EpmB